MHVRNSDDIVFKSVDVKMKRTWVCHFCLNQIENNYQPEHCPCNVTFCVKCHTALPQKAILCYGCATLNPKKEPRFTAADSTAIIFVLDNWQKKNQNPKADGPYCLISQENDYFIIKKENFLDLNKQGRKLTEQEIIDLNLKTRYAV